jgi:hypothetical protein
MREARPGWIFDLDDRPAGRPSTAEILEVLHVPGYTMFRVRWEDGSESILLPSHKHRAHPPAVGDRPLGDQSRAVDPLRFEL